MVITGETFIAVENSTLASSFPEAEIVGDIFMFGDTATFSGVLTFFLSFKLNPHLGQNIASYGISDMQFLQCIFIPPLRSLGII